MNDNVLGGLLIVTPSADGKDIQAQKVVSPGVLTTANKWDESQYPQTQDTDSVKITTDASATVGASVPLWGSLTSNFSANSVYQVDWDMEGFGIVSKKEDPAHSDFVASMGTLCSVESLYLRTTE